MDIIEVKHRPLRIVFGWGSSDKKTCICNIYIGKQFITLHSYTTLFK